MKRPARVRTVKRLKMRQLRVISLYTASFSDADFAACLQSLTKESSKNPTFRCQVQLTIERLDLLGPFSTDGPRGVTLWFAGLRRTWVNSISSYAVLFQMQLQPQFVLSFGFCCALLSQWAFSPAWMKRFGTYVVYTSWMPTFHEQPFVKQSGARFVMKWGCVVFPQDLT